MKKITEKYSRKRKKYLPDLKRFCKLLVTTDLHKTRTECVYLNFGFPFIYSQCRKAIRMTCPRSVVIPRCLLAFSFLTSPK